MSTEDESTLSQLRLLLPRLRQEFGVASLALFGSCARGLSSTGSDVDVLVMFRPDARVTLMTLAQMTRVLEGALGRRVDVVEDHPRLRPAFRREIQKDLLRVA